MSEINKKLILMHVTDQSIRLADGDVMSNVHIKQVGTTYGRFIFTEFSPMVIIDGTGAGITIKDCAFEGNSETNTLINVNPRKIRELKQRLESSDLVTVEDN